MMMGNDNGDSTPPTKPMAPRDLNATRDNAVMISLLREVRTDQMHSRREFQDSMRRLEDSIVEQSRSINLLSTDIASLSIRTATLESSLKKSEGTLTTVKERQDGCLARIEREDENTEIRKMRTDLMDAIEKQSLRKRQTPLYSRPPRIRSWWGTEAGKAVLLALAGLLVALSTMIGTYQFAKPTEAQRTIIEAAGTAARKAVERKTVEKPTAPVESPADGSVSEAGDSDCGVSDGAAMDF